MKGKPWKVAVKWGIGWSKVAYDPYKHEHFVLAEDESMKVVDAFIVEIDNEGVWAFKPTLKEVNLLEV